MKQEEVLKKAFGKRWIDCKDKIDKSGWMPCSFVEYLFFSGPTETKRQGDDVFWRPSILKGLEDNNGWIKLETVKDVPKGGVYQVVSKETGKASIENIIPRIIGAQMILDLYSHYQPIELKELPLH